MHKIRSSKVTWYGTVLWVIVALLFFILWFNKNALPSLIFSIGFLLIAVWYNYSRRRALKLTEDGIEYFSWGKTKLIPYSSLSNIYVRYTPFNLMIGVQPGGIMNLFFLPFLPYHGLGFLNINYASIKITGPQINKDQARNFMSALSSYLSPSLEFNNISEIGKKGNVKKLIYEWKSK